MDRRKFIKRLGVGVGITVVAPTMIIPKAKGSLIHPTTGKIVNKAILTKAEEVRFTSVVDYLLSNPNNLIQAMDGICFNKAAEMFPLLNLTDSVAKHNTNIENERYEWNTYK